MRSDEGRLNIGIIGAGRVGPVLGRALAGAGHSVTSINAVGDSGKERAEALLPGVQLKDPDEIVRESQLVIFAVPSEELPALIQGLTDTAAWQPGQLVLHTAPEYGFTVFQPAMQFGVIPIAFHPAMVFSGTSLDLARLYEATVAVSAPTPVLPIAQALAVEMGAEPVVVDESVREEYADATSALSVLTGSLVTQTLETLNNLGIDFPARTVGSIARAAVDEALAGAPSESPLDDLQ